MATEFKLTDKEEKRVKAFLEEHSHKGMNKGAIGGHIDYIFTPNSLFRGLSIKCNICKEEKNITDYSVW